MKRIILLSIISGVLFGQQSKPKHYRSAGFLDHKTGMSLVSYARTLKHHNKSEYFVGIGTLIAANTFALGWKYSFLQPEAEYDPNTGFRHLQGCYIDHDSTEGKLRLLKSIEANK